MASLTRWVLAHKRIVVVFWVALTLVGIASAGSATKALKQKFSVPGKEGWVTNQQIARDFHGTGGNSAPLLPVVTLPAGRVGGLARRPAPNCAASKRACRRTLPGSRVAGYASTGSRAFVSEDGRTTFIDRLPAAGPQPAFNDNPKAAEEGDARR